MPRRSDPENLETNKGKKKIDFYLAFLAKEAATTVTMHAQTRPTHVHTHARHTNRPTRTHMAPVSHPAAHCSLHVRHMPHKCSLKSPHDGTNAVPNTTHMCTQTSTRTQSLDHARKPERPLHTQTRRVPTHHQQSPTKHDNMRKISETQLSTS